MAWKIAYQKGNMVRIETELNNGDILVTGPEALNNARLVEVAPEMYEALRWLLHLHSGISKGGCGVPITQEEWKEALDSGKNALEKARV